ncbi:MAG: dihydropteroate synthase [Thermoplasmata archaeon]
MAARTVAPSPSSRYRARVLDVERFREIAQEIQRTHCDPEGVGIMTRKARIFPVRLDDVSLKAAPLLKQEMLAVGGDAAHDRGIADHSVPHTSVVLLATLGQYRRLLPKLRRQPFHLTAIADAVDQALHHATSTAPRTVHGVHRSVVVGERTLVMGVVNVTPDSFSDGGAFLDPDTAIAHARTLVAEGADLLDVGGESTRPGASEVAEEEEWRRIAPVVAALHGELRVPISVDTRHPSVASRALEAGADLVNDVEGLRRPAMREVLLATGAPAIAMHMRGLPTTMQANAEYTDLRAEVFGFLAEATARALADGIPPDRLLVDPGLGFGKSAEHNLELVRHLREFRSLGFPIVVGASRKSFLGVALGGAEPGERGEAGIAAAVLAAANGADIVRVHDVLPVVRALRFTDAVGRAGLARAPIEDGYSDPDA